MASFSELKQKLEQMKFDAAHLDRQRGEHHLPLFDSSLFTCRSRLLTPCVEEATATFSAIEREQQQKLLTAQRLSI
ncbi:primosomal replication protein N prime prime [Vibrio sp. JCM 19236]|nr:primosomal replication protein N prime prime [Vibrio sp. JCM 19236]